MEEHFSATIRQSRCGNVVEQATPCWTSEAAQQDCVNCFACRMHGMKVGNFSYEDNSLYIGQLWGNHFEIVLRDVRDATEDTVSVL